MRRRYHLGVDLGQRQDHTAIAIVEQRLQTTRHRDPITYQPLTTRHQILVHLERPPLGTAYTKITRRLEELTHHLNQQSDHVSTTVDATGLGSVIAETLQQSNLAGDLFPVVFTAGEHQRYDRGHFNVPKNDLLHNLLTDLENTKLAFPPNLPLLPDLESELLSLKRETHQGRLTWHSTGQHDDLVMALCLALYGQRQRPL